MAYIPVDNTDVPVIKQSTTLDRYIDLEASINGVNKPDNRSTLVEIYGDQLVGGPVGLCEMAGTTTATSTNDEVTYWEAARLHKLLSGTIAATNPSDTGGKLITTSTDHIAIVNDVVMLNGKIRARVTTVNSATSYTVTPLKATWGATLAANEHVIVNKAGNMFAQGTDQPNEFELSNLVRRTQPHMIFKMTYAASGSQMGNIGWVQDTDSGQFYWYLKGLGDQRKRAMNYLESLSMFAQTVENTNLTDINGSEGYIDAIENRGVVKQGYITDIQDLRNLSVLLDKQGAGNEYFFFMNRVQANFMDEAVAGAAGSVSQPSYGAFSNGKDMSINLGFKGVSVGGRDWYFKTLPILIDPQFGGATDYYKYFMTPTGTVTDPKTGIQAPTLETNYKAYSSGKLRNLEHWIGGGVDGVYQNNFDKRTFEYRSEFALVTRGANRHVVGRGE